ncbi:MAG: hypothetical protein QNJ07_02925 [Woeseiaceae bacterium]|nr:hypothetical protein [Woeseiaceae bacterium]
MPETTIRFSRISSVMATILLLFVAAPDVVAEQRFLRVDTTADNRPRALQAAVVTYTSGHGDDTVTVDLISALHVGDASYYAALNERFEIYDALLYELIAAGEARTPQRDARKSGAISSTQGIVGGALDLTFQLDHIDYDRPNFVHADFSPDELSGDMQARGESLYDYFWRIFFTAVAESANDPLGIKAMLRMSRSLESEDSLKVFLAYDLARQADLGEVLSGPDGSAIIEGRNERALEVMQAQIESGARRIGIFYGAGHMQDLESRLRTELQFVKQEELWIDAWSLE